MKNTLRKPYLRILIYLAAASLVVLSLAYQLTTRAQIDVGSGRDTAFVEGFSFREDSPAGMFRWSSGRADIRLWGIGDQSGILKLSLAAPRPAGIATVGVWVNGTSLGEIHPGASPREFDFPLDRATIGIGGDLVVTLASDTFTQAPDTRELGAQVYQVRFDSGGAPVLPATRALYLVALTLLAFLVARVWSGSMTAAQGVAALAILVEAVGVITVRVETVWFAAPLFWGGVAALIAALALAWAIQRLSVALTGASLSTATLRLAFVAMTAAFAVRMILATGPGFITDVQDYVVWSYKTVTYGLGTAYAAINGLWIADQSPGLVYLLHAMGLIYRAVFSPDFLYPGVAGDPAVRAANALTNNPALFADPVQRTLLRVPSLLADLATGALIFAAASKTPLFPPLDKGGRGGVAPWLVAIAYWFNPAVLWNGAYWGQTDAVHTLLVLAAFLLIAVNRIGASFFILGVAVLTKPQAAVFAPLLLLWAWKTSAHPLIEGALSHPPSGKADTPLSPPLGKGGMGGLLRALVAGAAGAGLMLVPMVLAGGGSGMLAYFLDTIGHHPILSANAHNLWWFLRNGSIDLPDTSELVPGIPFTYRELSLLLFGAFYLAVLLKAWRRASADYFALGAFIGLAFFMLPTEIHENYGYALLPLLAVAMTRDKTWVASYIAVSATMVLNYALSDPPLFALLGLSDPSTQFALPRELNALANTAIFAAWAFYLFARRGVAVKAEPSLIRQGLTQ